MWFWKRYFEFYEAAKKQLGGHIHRGASRQKKRSSYTLFVFMSVNSFRKNYFYLGNFIYIQNLITGKNQFEIKLYDDT